MPAEVYNAHFPLYSAVSAVYNCPLPPEVSSVYSPVHSALAAGLFHFLFLQKSLVHIYLYTDPCKQVYSLSYSSRSLQGIIPCTVHLFKSSSPCPIPPEVFSAHFPVQRALAAGLVPVLFLQKSLMHVPLFGAPFQKLLFLSFSSRTLPCPFQCIQRPINMSILCPITLEIFLAHSTVQCALSAGLVRVLFLPKYSMHISLYRAPYQKSIIVHIHGKSSGHIPLYSAP